MINKKLISGIALLSLGLFAIGYGVAKVSFNQSQKSVAPITETYETPVIMMSDTPDEIDLELQAFLNTSLHFSDVNIDDMGSGQCKKANWYNDAKNSYESLSNEAKDRLAEGSNYVEARNRFQAWASANNEIIDFANHSFISLNGEEGNSLENKIIVASVAGGFAVAAGTFVGVMIFKAKH